jgi:adenylosuccinate synthase
MPATVIVGGQYGSEGKGKVTALTASEVPDPWVVRCGGPNSGHTIWVNNERIVLRQLPAAAPQPDAHLAIAAGCVIDEARLLEEIELLRVDRSRLIVDPRAVLVELEDLRNETSLASAIGSTGSGTGAAAARRLLRGGDVRLVEHSRRIREAATVEIVASRLHSALDSGEHVIIEGTQGFGLSLLHGPGYPYLTSKDTTASAFAMEAGLAPSDVTNITVVIRTFPIRVGGQSGDLRNEVTWGFVGEYSNAPMEEPEFTSVTDRLRRVAQFDVELVRTACRYNRPTSIAVMGIDRLDYANRGIIDATCLSARAVEFLKMLRLELGVPLGWVGTGFSTLDAFNLLNANATASRV